MNASNKKSVPDHAADFRARERRPGRHTTARFNGVDQRIPADAAEERAKYATFLEQPAAARSRTSEDTFTAKICFMKHHLSSRSP